MFKFELDDVVVLKVYGTDVECKVAGRAEYTDTEFENHYLLDYLVQNEVAQDFTNSWFEESKITKKQDNEPYATA
jgi:hypothetical protein